MTKINTVKSYTLTELVKRFNLTQEQTEFLKEFRLDDNYKFYVKKESSTLYLLSSLLIGSKFTEELFLIEKR